MHLKTLPRKRGAQQRLTKLLTILAVSLALGGCTKVDLIGECAWVKAITLAPDDVVSRTTENEIIAHNRKVYEFCRQN